jgi:hypothetical protein
MSTEQQYWNELVGAALLGVDRRDPPPAPAGPFGELAVALPPQGPAEALLQQVAAAAVVRRAAFLPRAAAPPPAPPPPDHRPVTPPSASVTWRRIVADWALLEDEWLVAVIRTGHRVAPELVPRLLARHRGDAVRHARVALAGGPLAEWLWQHSPALACTRRAVVAPELLLEVPELAITPDFAVLAASPPSRVAEVLTKGLLEGTLGLAQHRVLQHLVARLPIESLPVVTAALEGVDPGARSIGLAFALADLARLRLTMLTELEPS